MTDRNRLIELMQDWGTENTDSFPFESVADYLLANGVIVPPCKVGDTTFLLLEKLRGGYDIVESQCVCIAENKYGKVYSMAFDCAEIGNTLEYHNADFGRWVFLTKAQAEKALAERIGKNG